MKLRLKNRSLGLVHQMLDTYTSYSVRTPVGTVACSIPQTQGKLHWISMDWGLRETDLSQKTVVAGGSMWLQSVVVASGGM